jgi:hypothetical protein
MARQGYVGIHEYAAIGDGRTIALIDVDVIEGGEDPRELTRCDHVRARMAVTNLNHLTGRGLD